MDEKDRTPAGDGPTIRSEAIEDMLNACNIQVGQPPGTTATFVHVFLPGGFYLATGHSACVAPANFDADKGLEIAQKDAVGKARDKLWELEGYRLYCALQHQQETTH